MEIKEIINQLGIENQGDSEEDIIQAITLRVRDMLDKSPDLLFSYMYRLDVEESAIDHALKNNKLYATDEALARLIWERQKKRLAFKKQFPVKPLDDKDLSY